MKELKKSSARDTYPDTHERDTPHTFNVTHTTELYNTTQLRILPKLPQSRYIRKADAAAPAGLMVTRAVPCRAHECRALPCDSDGFSHRVLTTLWSRCHIQE